MVDGGRCGAQGPVARLRDGEVWALMSGHKDMGQRLEDTYTWQTCRHRPQPALHTHRDR